MIDRRLFDEVDWYLIGLSVGLALIGLLFIYDASHLLTSAYYLKQLVWILLGLGAMALFALVDYKFLLSLSLPLYVMTVAVLAGMLVFAGLIAGTKSWIRTGLFQIQPSEAAKLVMILFLARLFANHKERYISSSLSITAMMATAIPVFLIAVQPDLGTALTYVPIIGGALILAGLKKKTIIIILVLAALTGTLGWNFGLHDYQKKRVIMLLNPHQDPRGAGYQVIQSKIAVGSGGLTGKGFMKGSQNQLRFLPARHTDFIFSVVAEEFGFLGVMFILSLYVLLFWRIFRAVVKARDRAGVYIIFLAGMVLAFQFLVNVMMVVGLFPVTGITLPLMSYGGSSLITSFAAIGLVLNVRMRRFAHV